MLCNQKKEDALMVTTPIRSKQEIEVLKNYYLDHKRYRDYTMFVVGINTALRISDLLLLKWCHVYDYKNKRYRRHLEVTEQKTQKRSVIAINNSCIEAFELLRFHTQTDAEEYIFCRKDDHYSHISRNRAYHIIKDVAVANSIDGNISCHSLRKTFGYHAWKQGTPSALIMNIYNHSSIEITKRYLSIYQDDKDELYNSMNL